MCMGRLLRFDGRFPTARFAVFTARSLVPSLNGFPARTYSNVYENLVERWELRKRE